jgi:hypothetical protein
VSEGDESPRRSNEGLKDDVRVIRRVEIGLVRVETATVPGARLREKRTTYAMDMSLWVMATRSGSQVT